MDQKSLSHVEIKNADRGEVSAVFSTFNVTDKDGDVTLPGAFTDGDEVLISSYGHTSWQGALPVGKGRIRTTKSEAILDGQFFMDTSHGRDTFAVVKALGGSQQWSYGFDVLDAEPGKHEGRDVKMLKRLKVHEVSPVLIGAGVNTRTLAVKALQDRGYDLNDAVKLADRTVSEYKAAIRPHESRVTAKAWNPQVIDHIPADASIPELRAVFAWCDPTADPEAKSSYRFGHHELDGEANIRACLLGIASLNGAKGAPIPDEDRRGVYNHLAAHLLDADLEPPDLRAVGDTGSLKFYEEVDVVMAAVHHLKHRASEVMALRAAKGKTLAATSIKRLEWLYDELRDLRSLLDTPQEDAAREYARFLQSLNTQES